MTDTLPPEPQKKRRWLMPLLFMSLFLNLLVAGLVVGAVLSPDSPRNRGDHGPARGVIGEPFIRALPRAERRALLSDVRQNHSRVQEGRDNLRARFEAFLAVLRTDPFDQDEAARLLAEQRQVAVGRQEVGEAFLMKRLTAMTAEQRALYADELERMLGRLKKR